jgi:hypothetical protein
VANGSSFATGGKTGVATGASADSTNAGAGQSWGKALSTEDGLSGGFGAASAF